MRIALEAMLANDDNEKSQIRYRLSTRAAWLLGSTPDERLGHRKTFRWAYDRTSKAVHEGQLDDDDISLLNSVAANAQDILRKYIRDKKLPDWEKLELGG